jgi:predicted DNA-binding transcriptional regulator YafY
MLPPIDLGPDEAAAVWTSGLGALRLSLHPLRDELESALRKLVVGVKGLPPRAAATEELATAASADAEKLLPKLVDAWERRSRLRISYWRVSSGDVVERDVDVYGWARRRGEWIRGSLAGIAKQLLPTAQVTTDESGARVARLAVRNLRGLVRQALAWGPDAEIVEPAEARATAREILASVVDTQSWGMP